MAWEVRRGSNKSLRSSIGCTTKVLVLILVKSSHPFHYWSPTLFFTRVLFVLFRLLIPRNGFKEMLHFEFCCHPFFFFLEKTRMNYGLFAHLIVHLPVLVLSYRWLEKRDLISTPLLVCGDNILKISMISVWTLVLMRDWTRDFLELKETCFVDNKLWLPLQMRLKIFKYNCTFHGNRAINCI